MKVLRTDINTITVTWTPMNLTEARGFVTGYKITYSSVSRRRRSADTGTVTVNGRFQNSRSISGLDGLKKYGVTVAGITGVGVGSASKMTYEGWLPFIKLLECYIIFYFRFRSFKFWLRENKLWGNSWDHFWNIWCHSCPVSCCLCGSFGVLEDERKTGVRDM